MPIYICSCKEGMDEIHDYVAQADESLESRSQGDEFETPSEKYYTLHRTSSSVSAAGRASE